MRTMGYALSLAVLLSYETHAHRAMYCCVHLTLEVCVTACQHEYAATTSLIFSKIS